MTTQNYTQIVSRLRDRIKANRSDNVFSEVYDEYHGFLVKHHPVTIGGDTFLYHANVRSNPIKRFTVKYIMSGKRVLDIGMGDATVAATLARNGNHVVGVDVSGLAVEMARDRFRDIKNLNIRRMDARHLDLTSRSFDCAVSLDVIEHLPYEDAAQHLKEVNKVLKKGGVYLIWTVLRCMDEMEQELHLKVYSLSELASLLKQSGFEVTFYDVRFILFDRIIRLPKALNRAVFIYEKLLHAIHLAAVFKKVDYLKWLIMPPCMIEARKVR